MRSITFFGHRVIDDYRNVEQKLRKLLLSILDNNEYIEFYVGYDGDFDIMASSVLKNIKRTLSYDNFSINLILPYMRKNMDMLEKYYDSVMIPLSLRFTHPKRAIIERNQWMIEKSDILICYVIKNEGGAAKALNYAEKNNKYIFNLSK